MKVYKVKKTFLVIASNAIAAGEIVRSRDVADHFEVDETIEEVGPEFKLNKPRMKPWLDELKRQLS